MLQAGQKRLLFRLHGRVEVDVDTGLPGQRGHDVTGWAAPHGVEAVLVEGQSVQFREMEPGKEVGRHGVGERSVAVEEEGVVVLEVPHGEIVGECRCLPKRGQ